MYWTLQNLKDSENKQQILHHGSTFSAATVLVSEQLTAHLRVVAAENNQTEFQYRCAVLQELLHGTGCL
jgi:hypothetical protein